MKVEKRKALEQQKPPKADTCPSCHGIRKLKPKPSIKPVKGKENEDPTSLVKSETSQLGSKSKGIALSESLVTGAYGDRHLVPSLATHVTEITLEHVVEAFKKKRRLKFVTSDLRLALKKKLKHYQDQIKEELIYIK